MKRSIGLVIVMFMCVVVCRAQYVTIALNLTNGSTYYQNTIANVNVVQSINGQKSNIITTLTGKLAFTVTAIHDSLYTMEARYLSMTLNMQLPTGIMDYSSEKPDAKDPISTAFAAFKNQPIDIIMTRTGKLRSLTGIDAIFNRIVAGLPNVSAEQQQQIKSLMEQSYGDRAFKSNLEMSGVIFPSIPVKKNAFWVIDSELETMRAANLHTIYELRDITDADYLIHGNSTITYQNANEFVETNGMPLRYQLSGFMQNDIRVDKTTGWVKESRIVQTISGNTEIKANPKMPAGMIIPMSMKSEMVVTDK